MKNNICVYQHRRLDSNEIFYVGIGSIARSKIINTRNSYWKNIVNKYGYEIEILFENLTRIEACQIEQYLIKYYGRKDLGLGLLVNMTDGGDGGLNQIKSKEGIERIRKSATGRKHTLETIEKLRNLRLGKKTSEETKQKLRNAHLGKKHDTTNRKKFSDETKLKMSLAKIGSKHVRARKILDTVTLKIFNTLTEASEILNVPQGTLHGYLNGTIKTNKTNCIYYD